MRITCIPSSGVLKAAPYVSSVVFFSAMCFQLLEDFMFFNIKVVILHVQYLRLKMA